MLTPGIYKNAADKHLRSLSPFVLITHVVSTGSQITSLRHLDYAIAQLHFTFYRLGKTEFPFG